MNKLPVNLKKYFWDIDFTKLKPGKSRIYIIKRILEHGDEVAVRWMFKNFKKSEIKDALRNFRGYSQKSANFWAFVLDVPREEVLCLKTRSLKALKTLWPY